TPPLPLPTHHPSPPRRSSDLYRPRQTTVKQRLRLANTGPIPPVGPRSLAMAATSTSTSARETRSRALYSPTEVDVEVAAIANERDRKSTRLNSSHVSISYAVF